MPYSRDSNVGPLFFNSVGVVGCSHENSIVLANKVIMNLIVFISKQFFLDYNKVATKDIAVA